MAVTIVLALVLFQHDNYGYSEFGKVHSKAQLAAPGPFPGQELKRSLWAFPSSPEGRPCAVPQRRRLKAPTVGAVLDKGMALALRTAPCCKTAQGRCIRNYHIERVLVTIEFRML